MNQNNQRGFALVTAIFLLVVLSALGAVMVSFSGVQQQSSALDVLGARAYQAARAGIEWGAYQTVQSGSCAPSSTVTLGGTLAGFSVTVTCNSTAHTEAGATLAVYQLTSTASGGQGAAAGSPDYVERRITASFTQ